MLFPPSLFRFHSPTFSFLSFIPLCFIPHKFLFSTYSQSFSELTPLILLHLNFFRVSHYICFSYLLSYFSPVCLYVYKLYACCFAFASHSLLGLPFTSCTVPFVLLSLKNTFKLCCYDPFHPFRHYSHTLSFPCHFNLYLGLCPLFSRGTLPLSFTYFSHCWFFHCLPPFISPPFSFIRKPCNSSSSSLDVFITIFLSTPWFLWDNPASLSSLFSSLHTHNQSFKTNLAVISGRFLKLIFFTILAFIYFLWSYFLSSPSCESNSILVWFILLLILSSFFESCSLHEKRMFIRFHAVYKSTVFSPCIPGLTF